MIRVVLDSNIFISALLSPLGPPSQIPQMTVPDTDTQLCVSGEVYAEYEDVIRPPAICALNPVVDSGSAEGDRSDAVGRANGSIDVGLGEWRLIWV